MDNTTVVAILSGPVLLILREIAGWYFNKRKIDIEEQDQRVKDNIAINEQAVRVYKDIVDSLKGDITKLLSTIHELDAEHVKCREENFALRLKMTENERRVCNLETKVNGS